MPYHNFWTLISDNGCKYRLQINDEKNFFIIATNIDGSENKVELIGDSYEESVIKGLKQIDEKNNEYIFNETLRIAMKNLNEYLNHR